MKGITLTLFCIVLLQGYALGTRKIILYWGQNTARLPEKELDHFCTTGDYDVIVVGYITKFFASATTRYPGMNLAVHCGVLQNKAYPALFSCGGIGNAIKKCQARGIKVLLGIQGGEGKQFLTSADDGKLFATRIWNLFLGGKNSRSLRPFESAVMDGINLNIEAGDDRYYKNMIEQINSLMATDRGRTYMITASPSCGLPSKDFKTIFKTSPQFFDALFIKHDYNMNCHPTGDKFQENLKEWIAAIQTMNDRSFKNTQFYLSLVLSKELRFYQTSFAEFEGIYKKVLKDIPEFGGVALNDAGWDDLELVDNNRYSAHVRNLFEGPKTTTWAPATTSTASTESTTTTTTEPPKPRKIAALWGSNLARKATGLNEESLRYFCERGFYDTIIVNTLTDDANDQNKNNLPGLNFANHCFNLMGPGYQNYLRCDAMAHDIRFCQTKGVKVLLNIGGSVRFIGFGSRNESFKLAQNLWKLFLGGKKQAREEGLPRTFGDTVLDGINLELRLAEKSFFVDFVKEMRRIMDEPSNKKPYFITANPSCLHPNRILHESFTQAIYAFDHLYVNFDDQICNINEPEKFHPAFQLWYDYTFKQGGPDLYIGLPSDPRNTQDSQRYLQRSRIRTRLDLYLRTYRNFGGVLLNDASWDDRNLINNIRYSEDLGKVLRHEDQKKATTATPKPTTTRRRIFINKGTGKDGGEFLGGKDREERVNKEKNGGVDGGDSRPRNNGPSIFIVRGPVFNKSATWTPNILLLCFLVVISTLMVCCKL